MPDLSLFHSAFLLSCLGTLALSQSTILSPHHLYDSSHATQGLVHRDALRGELVQTPSALLNALALRDAEMFVWASPKGTRGAPQVAVMQMDTLKQEKAINMQRFAHLLADVECKSSQVTVQFVTKAAFEAASQLWSALNSGKINHLKLFTSWKGCYTEGGNLKPFHLTQVSFDSKKLAATLTGSETDWATAAHTFILSIGERFDETLATADRSSRPLLTRSSIFTKAEEDFKKEVAKEFNSAAMSMDKVDTKFLKGIKKALHAKLVDVDKPFSINFDKSYTGTKTLSTPGNAASLGGSMTCTACGPHGSLVFGIHIEVAFGGKRTVKFTMKPKNLGVLLGLSMSAKSDLPESFAIESPLLEQTIPGAGFSIPELASAGLTASLDYGISVSNFKGSLSVAKNLSVSIPDTAEVEVVITSSDDEQSKLGGSWTPVAQSTPMHVSGFGSGEFAVGLDLSLSLTVKVLTVDITPAKVTLGGPSVGFKFGVSSENHGPCPCLSSSHGPTYYIIPRVGFSLSLGSELSARGGVWGLGIPIPPSGGFNTNSSQGTGGDGGGGTNSPRPSSTHTNPDQKDSSQPAVGTRSVNKRYNHDPISASKISIGASKTLFEKDFQLHSPICFTSGHHQRRSLSNTGREDEPDGGPRRLSSSSE